MPSASVVPPSLKMRREMKATSKSNSEPATPTTPSSTRQETKAKFVITRHRALYSNTSELKEFISFKIGRPKRQKLNDQGDFQQLDSSQDLVLSLHNLIQSPDYSLH